MDNIAVAVVDWLNKGPPVPFDGDCKARRGDGPVYYPFIFEDLKLLLDVPIVVPIMQILKSLGQSTNRIE